ncbi:hypothetical protein TruAng_000004 [Truncatella angustata]|nr:hypothetical protein TruAng_000004 [Truncatella angustata]
MPRSSLPQDIVLLLCQELAFRCDFATLFQCSLVSRRVASLAIEQLYGAVPTAAVHLRFQTAQAATFVKPRDLLLIFDHGDYPEPQDEIKQFVVLRGNQTLKRPTRSQAMPLFDFQQSMIEAGEAITQCVKQAADQTETSVTLVHLEVTMIPREILPVWLTRLPSLQSLHLQDGSSLTAEAASAIAQWCPKFSEFRCLTCRGDEIDENVARFFQILRPNTLQCFEIISFNDIGEQTLIALNAHAVSLKVLTLGSLPGAVMSSLNVLPACVALESLSLESQRHNPCDLAGNETVLKEIASWIQNCTKLRNLTLTNIRDGLLVVKDVLNSPGIRLRALDLQGFSSHGEEVDVAAWKALAQQDELEDLAIGGLDGMPDALIIHETPPLAESICKLNNLKSLDLKRASVRAIELRKIIMALPALTNLSFGGDWIDDQILESLGTIRHLQNLLVNALSVFTFEGLQTFAQNLDPERQKGIVVEINNQIGNWKFNEDEEAWLVSHFVNVLGGRIDIGVFKDPDEAHEGDFSSDSD